ncbi:glutathione S-transferase N-terminal domain-containing protein [Rhodoferax sp. AJA081-3]|uniref:glutathione S-transferase family protein n=1 Tax=Rhodoferax sp. AJA081-3 TaxID=2752316 RepID=UPI001AE01BBD|nr:glutathione binding-like protein [Rhodoferax sp. AJA081-3]QTN27854.1 glutathione S-transferase N-terminal domain-containing protein [Rhodoferax sp. AJA081-3]
MIDVYTANTPNGVKVPIALEELAVPYRVIRVDLGALEQKRSDFLRLNPNGRIPAIVDNDGPGNAPLSVFESGAILWYLAEKFPGLMPESPVERIRALEYTFFQVGGVGPMFGQAGWFMRHSEPMPLAVARYQTESNRLTAVLEARLQVSPWLAGESYSVADIMNFGWLRAAQYAGVPLDNYPAVRAWVTRMAARPAVIRGLQAIA